MPYIVRVDWGVTPSLVNYFGPNGTWPQQPEFALVFQDYEHAWAVVHQVTSQYWVNVVQATVVPVPGVGPAIEPPRSRFDRPDPI